MPDLLLLRGKQQVFEGAEITWHATVGRVKLGQPIWGGARVHLEKNHNKTAREHSMEQSAAASTFQPSSVCATWLPTCTKARCTKMIACHVERCLELMKLLVPAVRRLKVDSYRKVLAEITSRVEPSLLVSCVSSPTQGPTGCHFGRFPAMKRVRHSPRFTRPCVVFRALLVCFFCNTETHRLSFQKISCDEESQPQPKKVQPFGTCAFQLFS